MGREERRVYGTGKRMLHTTTARKGREGERYNSYARPFDRERERDE
jgi:hypothetical protein